MKHITLLIELQYIFIVIRYIFLIDYFPVLIYVVKTIHYKEDMMSYLGENIPKLGFGLMRLPMIGEDIDISLTSDMVDMFIDSGYTYFDTAYGYNDGKSEEAAKAALVDRYPRGKFLLATKLPAYDAMNASEAKQMFWTSLKRTGAEYFDFYLLHNLGSIRTKSFYDFGIWDYVLELKEKGFIRHIGFSFHAKADLLEEILTKHPEMEFVQLQINYADWESPSVQSRQCYEVARNFNKSVVIMEPVRGGMLAERLPAEVKAVFDRAGTDASYASWAMRFAASLEGIITVLSGMSTLEQVRDNARTIRDIRPLTDKERAVIDEACKTLQSLPSIPCTDCGYCSQGCPEGIVIPEILDSFNREILYNSPESAKGGYRWNTRFGGKASACIQCGKCEEVCPQGIKIIEHLKEAAAKYE